MANDKAAKTAIEDEKWDDVEDIFAEPWKEPKEGDFIVGMLVGEKPVMGSNNKTFQTYIIKKLDDTLVSVAGSGLENRMARIPTGTKVKVTYNGKVKVRQGTMKDYTVQTAPGTQLKPAKFKRADDDASDSDLPF